jgi:hypothetical protein
VFAQNKLFFPQYATFFVRTHPGPVTLSVSLLSGACATKANGDVVFEASFQRLDNCKVCPTAPQVSEHNTQHFSLK